MDKSKFSMWRASFAFCHIDSILSQEEITWINSKLKSLPFTDEEKKIITDDMKNPPKVEDIFAQVTNVVDRGLLVNEIRKLAHLDNNLTESEKEKITKIQKAVMSKINIDEVEAEVVREKDRSLSIGEDQEGFFKSFIKLR